MELKPLFDRVVLRMTEAEKTTKSGLILTESAAEKPQIAEVVAVGPGGVVDGEKIEITDGDVIKLPAGCRHTVIAKTRLELIEVQNGSEISVSDKIKYEYEF